MKMCKCTQILLTNNHPNFTAAIFIIAGDHGGHCVIHHGNHVHLKFLHKTIHIMKMKSHPLAHKQVLNICLGLFIVMTNTS